MIGVRAILRLNEDRTAAVENEVRPSRPPAGLWTLWTPIAVAAVAGLVYGGYSAAFGPSGCLLLLAGIQSYFVVWCMIVGAVPVGLRWLYSDSEPYGFSVAAIVYLLIALTLGFGAILTGSG